MECKACEREKFRKENPNVPIMANAIVHICNQPERSKREDLPKLMRYTTPAKKFAKCMGEYKREDGCGALNS